MPAHVLRATALPSLLLIVLACVPLSAQEQMVFGDPREIESELKVRQGLQTSVTLNLNETPLADAVSALESQIGQPIWIDQRALADAGADRDTPVTVHCVSLPARAALRLLLDPIDLAWTNQGGLVITSPEKASSVLVTRVYPIVDLVTMPGEGNAQLCFDYDSLIELITTTISPTSWDEVGGPGSISPHESTCTLVFNQTRDVHQQVEALLIAIRAARDWQGIPTSDVHLPWREFFSEHAERERAWREHDQSHPVPGELSVSPGQVEAWQRPKMHE